MMDGISSSLDETPLVTVIWEFRDRREILNPISTDYANRGKINRRRVAGWGWQWQCSSLGILERVAVARVRSRLPGDRRGDGTGWHRLASLSRGSYNLSLSLVTRSRRRIISSGLGHQLQSRHDPWLITTRGSAFPIVRLSVTSSLREISRVSWQNRIIIGSLNF